MSVGDLKNNLRKLQTSVRSVKYEKDIDYDSLSKGLVGSFLPIYHYLFLDYSHPIAEQISNHNIELSGKTDLRFCEAMYKVLRELFTYKPSITKEQLFANGFVERKVIMCNEIIILVRNKHRSLVPRSAKPRPGTASGQSAKLGPRQAAPVPAAKERFTSQDSSDAINAPLLFKPPMAPKPSAESPVSVQVINEIRNAVASSVPTVSADSSDDSFSSPILLGPHATAGSTQATSKDGCVSQAHDTALMDQRKNLRVQSEVVHSDGPNVRESQLRPWDAMQAVVVTSTGEDMRQEATYNPARYETEEEESDTEDQVFNPGPATQRASGPSHPRPIDIIPMTPARPPPVRIQSHLAPRMEEKPRPAADDIRDYLGRLEKANSDLCSRIMGLESRLGVVEGLLSMQQEKEKTAGQNDVSVLSAAQLETLLARMTLVENKVALVGAQKSSDRAPRQNTPVPISNDRLSQTKEKSQGTHPTASKAPPFGLSPITHGPQRSGSVDQNTAPETPGLTSGQVDLCQDDEGYDRRWSSTPTWPQNTSMSSGEVAEMSKTQADRIKQMLKSTENMLNIEVLSPAKSTTK